MPIQYGVDFLIDILAELEIFVGELASNHLNNVHQTVEHVVQSQLNWSFELMNKRVQEIEKSADGRKPRHIRSFKFSNRKLDLVITQHFRDLQVKLLFQAVQQLLLNMRRSFQ